MNNDALIWVVIVSLTSVGSNIAIMIGTFRRKPPAEAQFADAGKNSKDHAYLHHRIDEIIAPDKTPFVLKAVSDAEEKRRTEDRDEMKRDLKKLLQRTAKFAGFGDEESA